VGEGGNREIRWWGGGGAAAAAKTLRFGLTLK